MSRIRLITGSWDSGKTKKLLEIFKGLDSGTADGFASIKIFDSSGVFIGYSLKRLSTAEMFPLAILNDKFHDQLEENFEFSRFVFSKKTFEIASNIMEELIINEKIRTILMDEVGPLEIMGIGFANSLEDILRSSKDIYLVVKDRNIESVVKKFEIDNYIIITGKP